MEQRKNNKILLHACCGICSGYPISYLKDIGYDVVVYFCNPNLDIVDEFNRRLNAQKIVCDNFNVDLIIEEYNHKQYLDEIKGLENEPEKGKRCEKCIRLRLDLAGKKAKNSGINIFTTSLAISPHKDFQKITEIGVEIAKKYSIEYFAQNFRKQDGFLKTNNISKDLNLYRQKYCGCEFAKNI